MKDSSKVAILEETLELVLDDLLRALTSTHHFKMVDDVQRAAARIRVAQLMFDKTIVVHRCPVCNLTLPWLPKDAVPVAHDCPNWDTHGAKE